MIRGDVRRVPLPARSFDTVVANLPFGMVRKSSHDLETLYEGALEEAARLLVPSGVFVVITARRRLLEDIIGRSAGDWKQRWRSFR